MAESLHAGWTAVITGGAGGVGQAIARRLIERGMRCLLVDRDAAALERAARALGPAALIRQADLTDEDAVAGLIGHLQSEFGALDVLVNNVGITDTTPFERRSMASIHHEMDVNLRVPLTLTRALLPLLQRAGDGRVISIVSLGGLFPLPETSVYSCSKFGLRGAMLCLGLDGPRLGVRFTIVNPSATETPMLIREALEGGNKLQFLDPPQSPDEVAMTVLRALDRPVLERYVRRTESWTVRLAMLAPNLLARLIPLFAKQADKGHRRYVESLARRGLIERRQDGRWQLKS